MCRVGLDAGRVVPLAVTFEVGLQGQAAFCRMGKGVTCRDEA